MDNLCSSNLIFHDCIIYVLPIEIIEALFYGSSKRKAWNISGTHFSLLIVDQKYWKLVMVASLLVSHVVQVMHAL